MKTNYFALIIFALFLPGFLQPVKSLSLTKVNHNQRLEFAKQIIKATESTSELPIESYILKRFEAAFPNEAKGRIYSWANTLINEANRAAIDPLFVLAIIQQESRFNEKAVGRHGEIGLMQIRPRTAAWIASKNNLIFSGPSDLFRPDLNIKIGVLYLHYLNKKFKNVKYSTAAYNMGPLNLKRIIASQREPEIYHQSVYRHYKNYYRELSAQKDTFIVASN